MKSIFTVIASAILCVLLTTGFTKPVPFKNYSVANHAKWKHTTWVNPWVGVKKMHMTKSAINTARVDFAHECNTPSYVFKYRVFINSQEYQGCGVPMGVDTYYALGGSTVSVEMDVDRLYGMYYILIDDYDGMGGSTTLFYADSPAYVVYNFPVQAGHYYYIYTHTY